MEKLKEVFPQNEKQLLGEKNKEHGALDMSFDSFCEIYLEKMQPRIKVSTYEMKKNTN